MRGSPVIGYQGYSGFTPFTPSTDPEERLFSANFAITAELSGSGLLEASTGWKSEQSFWYYFIVELEDTVAFNYYPPEGGSGYSCIPVIDTMSNSDEPEALSHSIQLNPQSFNDVGGKERMEGYVLVASCNKFNFALVWTFNVDYWVPKANTLTSLVPQYSFTNYKWFFNDYSDWKRQTLTAELKNMLMGPYGADTLIELIPTMDPTGTVLTFQFKVNSTGTDFQLVDMSQRARLVTGYYDFDFDSPDTQYLAIQTAPSAPLAHFGNLL